MPLDKPITNLEALCKELSNMKFGEFEAGNIMLQDLLTIGEQYRIDGDRDKAISEYTTRLQYLISNFINDHAPGSKTLTGMGKPIEDITNELISFYDLNLDDVKIIMYPEMLTKARVGLEKASETFLENPELAFKGFYALDILFTRKFMAAFMAIGTWPMALKIAHGTNQAGFALDKIDKAVQESNKLFEDIEKILDHVEYGCYLGEIDSSCPEGDMCHAYQYIEDTLSAVRAIREQLDSINERVDAYQGGPSDIDEFIKIEDDMVRVKYLSKMYKNRLDYLLKIVENMPEWKTGFLPDRDFFKVHYPTYEPKLYRHAKEIAEARNTPWEVQQRLEKVMPGNTYVVEFPAGANSKANLELKISKERIYIADVSKLQQERSIDDYDEVRRVEAYYYDEDPEGNQILLPKVRMNEIFSGADHGNVANLPEYKRNAPIDAHIFGYRLQLEEPPAARNKDRLYPNEIYITVNADISLLRQYAILQDQRVSK
ncbi:MAG: hypothetical protein KKF44_07445 [Nanoarchaeota archaeon]|nr:hypothetical protein [Nanoarchaeota archaeon]